MSTRFLAEFERACINLFTILRVERKDGTLVDITGRKYRMKVYDPQTSETYCEADGVVTCELDGDVVTTAKVAFTFPPSATIGKKFTQAAYAVYEWKSESDGPYPKMQGPLTMVLWPDGVQAVPE